MLTDPRKSNAMVENPPEPQEASPYGKHEHSSTSVGGRITTSCQRNIAIGGVVVTVMLSGSVIITLLVLGII